MNLYALDLAENLIFSREDTTLWTRTSFHGITPVYLEDDEDIEGWVRLLARSDNDIICFLEDNVDTNDFDDLVSKIERVA